MCILRRSCFLGGFLAESHTKTLPCSSIHRQKRGVLVMNCNPNIMKAKKEANKLIMTLELNKRSGDILSFHLEVANINLVSEMVLNVIPTKFV